MKMLIRTERPYHPAETDGTSVSQKCDYISIENIACVHAACGGGVVWRRGAVWSHSTTRVYTQLHAHAKKIKETLKTNTNTHTKKKS